MKINTDTKDQLYIICIGASAGGMEAIHLLFDHTPEDGVAYVVVQHISADHKSFMAELLEKHSKLEVSIAEHGMLVEQNRVYLMPQGKFMTIKEGKLMLEDIKLNQPNKSIDIFLDSLALNSKEKSVAVILSGTGSDGTKGIAAIKNNGGFVIVQDPASSKFDGMPNSAIQSGNVDVILTPDLIPQEIITLLERDILENKMGGRLTETGEATLAQILGLIQEHTPLDFSEYKRPTIIRRVALEMAKNKIDTLENYALFLESNPSEISVLAKEFLISVTEFFRDKEAFEILEKEVIPVIIENKLQVDILKVWVVGCATGEEAYSLAIIIMEQLTALNRNLEVKIFASDIDKSALLYASKGIYSTNIEQQVSKKRLSKFFVKQGDQYKVRDSIRKMIVFADHDIIKHPPYGKIDLISCRNLLIYVNPILQKKILSSFHFCLNLRGYLILGPSESLGEGKKYFQEVSKKWRIFQNIEKAQNFNNNSYNTPGQVSRSNSLTQDAAPQKTELKGNLLEMVNSSLLDVSGYEAAIWINPDFNILHTLGNIQKFLLPKFFNFNLLEMLPEKLSIATSNTIRKALKSGKETAIQEVKFKRNDTSYAVNVVAKPILSKLPLSQSIIVVLFKDCNTKAVKANALEVFSLEEHTYRHLEDLKEELSGTKKQLRETTDALEESNDNISSYNEELISSNEEMQSVNEELQSVNEELQTVNNEYHLKIKELAELNDDLDNYFKSTINTQLYVDKDLILRKFTPSAVKQINLKDSDIGRTLSDISNNLRFSTLMDDIERVITSSAFIQKEVQTVDGRWYQMMAIPYVKQHDNQTHGVIITFNDITELKKAQDKLSRVNADHNNFIFAVSHDLKGPLGNIKMIISHLNEVIDPQSKDMLEYMTLLEKSTSNLNQIISELTDVSKIESEIEENINVQKLLKEVELSMKIMLDNSDAKVTYDLKEPEIQFSKKNLRSLIFNIFSNAIKYKSPDRPLEVTIRTQKSNDYILLSIQDNGLGIPENKIGKIFGVFQRAHKHVEGSGVGLYLAKKTITNAGGDIEVESEVGKGSIFKVYFKDKH